MKGRVTVASVNTTSWISFTGNDAGECTSIEVQNYSFNLQ
jgi:hypothetical protein